MFSSASSSPLVTTVSTKHPLVPLLLCQVLLYLDDIFTTITSLTLSFSKCTFIPLNVASEIAEQLDSVFGCLVSSFPQQYLGLRSPSKARIIDLIPLISHVHKWLTRLSGTPLSSASKGNFVEAILIALPTYTMGLYSLLKVGMPPL